MKFLGTVLLCMLTPFVRASNVNLSPEEELNHPEAHGIVETILDNRDFNTSGVRCNEWKFPNGDLYMIPIVTGKDDGGASTSVMGLSYKLINSDLSGIQSSDDRSVTKIRKGNIVNGGFSFEWEIHNKNGVSNDFTPCHAKTFSLESIHKDYLERDINVQSSSFSVEQLDSILWIREGGECDRIESKTHLLDTNHIDFSSVSSLNTSQSKNLKREKLNWPVLTTSYTNTIVASTLGVTVTQPRISDTLSPFGKQPAVGSSKGENDAGSVAKGIKLKLISSSVTLNTAPITETVIPVHEASISSFKSNCGVDCNSSFGYNVIGYSKPEEKSWKIPTSWNSYPFSNMEPSSVLLEIISKSYNSTLVSTVMKSSKSLTAYRLVTTNAFANETRTREQSKSSMAARVKTTDGDNGFASLNGVNNRWCNNSWNSVLAFLLASLSGVILI